MYWSASAGYLGIVATYLVPFLPLAAADVLDSALPFFSVTGSLIVLDYSGLVSDC